MTTNSYAVIVFVYSLLALAAAHAGEPLDFVKAMHERYLQLLQEPTLQSKDKERELNDRLQELEMPMVDFDEMAKRMLAKHWSLITGAEQKEFVEMFRNYFAAGNRLPTRFSSTNLVLEREKIDGDFAEVEGYFYFPARSNTPAVFKLHLVDGKWKLYDYTGWVVSSVEILRAQFTRVIAKSSFRGLINVLREKTEQKARGIR
jgi:phospholipid transport system substrate-binding protein